MQMEKGDLHTPLRRQRVSSEQTWVCVREQGPSVPQCVCRGVCVCDVYVSAFRCVCMWMGVCVRMVCMCMHTGGCVCVWMWMGVCVWYVCVCMQVGVYVCVCMHRCVRGSGAVCACLCRVCRAVHAWDEPQGWVSTCWRACSAPWPLPRRLQSVAPSLWSICPLRSVLRTYLSGLTALSL